MVTHSSFSFHTTSYKHRPQSPEGNKMCKEAGSEPDGVTYCTLIDIHSKSSILDIPWECMRGCKRLASLRIHLLTVLTINCLGKLAIRSCI
ncbi:pentatricopeptide repeat-containing protein At1g74750-like [Cucurbita moschata]|uniref:Pentatricopeptide repeat-containing protein At1g74750-like n=1 Tax=Cucurbita moschata TaxID=3662 RepID=A0A6J1E552_CUCMO|nr:pentatricopeptide repeat-containing protein At1g74750-like [Cucurbita moschata]